MTLVIASDHGGFGLKTTLVTALVERGVEVQDLGTHDWSSCDYPDFAHAVARAVLNDNDTRGILVCGTGLGMSMAANRHPGIRAAVLSDTYSARMAREHNDANVLCLGERVVGPGLALEIVRVWLDSPVDSALRHAQRIARIEPASQR